MQCSAAKGTFAHGLMPKLVSAMGSTANRPGRDQLSGDLDHMMC